MVELRDELSARVVRLAVGEGAARTGRLTLLLLSVLTREQLPPLCGPGCSDRATPPAHELSCGGRIFRETDDQPVGTGEPPWHGRLVAQRDASRDRILSPGTDSSGTAVSW